MKVYQLTWLTHCSSGTQTEFFKERDEYNLRKINYHIIQHVVNGLEVRMPLSKYKSQFVFKKNIRAIDKHGWNTTGINCTCVLMFTSFAYFQGIFSRKSIVLYTRNDQTESCLKTNGCQLFVPNRFLLLYLFSLTKEQHAFKLITTILYLRGDGVLCL